MLLAGCGGQSTVGAPLDANPDDRGPTTERPSEAPADDAKDNPGSNVAPPTAAGGTPGTDTGAAGALGTDIGAAGSADIPDDGPPPSPPGSNGTLSVAGPMGTYTFGTFVTTPELPSRDFGDSRGDGWVAPPYPIITDHVDFEVLEGATTAAVLVGLSGNMVDAAVSSCGPLPPTSARVLSVPAPYATIQGAIDDAQPGDTVSVAPGLYTGPLHLRSFVKLLGAGARDTILDGQNLGSSLIDFTGATGAVVSGFTLQNVGQRAECADNAPTDCSGDWYAAAVYAEGQGDGCGTESSLLFTRNVVTGNDIGFLLYFGPVAIVTNNLFLSNQYAFVANHHQSYGLVAQNVFYDNAEIAIDAQASYLSVTNNVIASNGIAFSREYVQRGFVGCNVTYENDALGEGFDQLGGYAELDPHFVAPGDFDFRLGTDSPALGQGCPGQDHGQLRGDPGAFAGTLGDWTR